MPPARLWIFVKPWRERKAQTCALRTPWWHMKTVSRSRSSEGAHSLKRLSGRRRAPSTRASSYSSGSRTSTRSDSSPRLRRSANSAGVIVRKLIGVRRRKVAAPRAESKRRRGDDRRGEARQNLRLRPLEGQERPRRLLRLHERAGREDEGEQDARRHAQARRRQLARHRH